MLYRSCRDPCGEVVIILNCLWMAIDTDNNPAAVLIDAPAIFQALVLVFEQLDGYISAWEMCSGFWLGRRHHDRAILAESRSMSLQPVVTPKSRKWARAHSGQVVEHLFCAYFFIELVIRFLAFAARLRGWQLKTTVFVQGPDRCAFEKIEPAAPAPRSTSATVSVTSGSSSTSA